MEDFRKKNYFPLLVHVIHEGKENNGYDVFKININGSA
jgi:hypothetical protein